MIQKSLIALLLFVVTVTKAQTDKQEAYATFKQQFEEYRDSPEVSSENSTIKPAPCGQYNLKFMITAGGDKEVVSVPPARKLCFDLNRFDRSKNPNTPEGWEYEIKPVGDRYYVIRGEKKGTGTQELYYYERNTKK